MSFKRSNHTFKNFANFDTASFPLFSIINDITILLSVILKVIVFELQYANRVESDTLLIVRPHSTRRTQVFI